MSVCKYVCMYVIECFMKSMSARAGVSMYVCMFVIEAGVFMYAYVCLYVCVYMCM